MAWKKVRGLRTGSDPSKTTEAGAETPTRGKSRGRARSFLAAALALGVVGSGLSLAPQAAFAEGGGGGVPGGGGSAGNFQLYWNFYDELNAAGTAPNQGYMTDSFNWFQSDVGRPGTGGNYTQVAQACTSALAKAEARAADAGQPAGLSRVVGIMWVGATDDPWAGNSSASASYFLDNMYADPMSRVLTSTPQFDAKAAIRNYFVEGVNESGDTPAAVCVALNSAEPAMNYDLSLTTDHSAGVPTTAGTRGAVHDVIHASANGSVIRESVNGTVTMRWRGPEGNTKAVTKNVAIANQGDTRSPDFVPADFGWHSWPSGKAWFDVAAPKQGQMNDAANHAGENDSRENWNVARDTSVVKTLTSGSPADNVRDEEVFASGMFYNARITAPTNGYSSRITIRDTILTDQVWIGSRTADVNSAPYMLDASGDRVAGAVITIDRSTANRVVVSGHVNNIPDAMQSRDYTLVVPTYFRPTEADYTVRDNSQVCYTTAVDECMSGNSEQTRKVTPKPDKVWVLDEEGGLTTADPNHTNQQGSDEKVFLMNDEVAAVVNGRIPANLAEPFTNYQLVDDWTDSAPYVDFSDPAKAKVFLETAPGSGTYTNVTSNFTITVNGSVTTATAREGSNFLAQSKGQTADRKTKLIVSGAFRDDYDTDGQVVRMVNKGSEVWNNETIPTNEPPVYTWTPDPNKQVVGSREEEGDHAYEDIDGMSVFPGQKLEYTVGVDLRVPSGTARGVKTLAVLDQYDPMFTPDKDSVEFFDSRDPQNPKPVPAKAYKVTWNDDSNSFQADFTKAWIDANVNVEGPNSEWLTKGWLTMRFTGTVKDEAPGGSTVKNQAFQIINDARTATEIPEVVIPKIEPDKEDLNTDLVDIDGKTVVKGDRILYRLTLDARPSADEMAYFVHKLGMVDNFDEEYLDLEVAGITVTNKATGEDVTGKFNVQVKDGVAYVFAKQVDSTNSRGVELKGDPQPEDLEAYSKAPITNTTPIIDQALLGHEYYIVLDTVVTKETDGYTIKNQATQNIQNTWHPTKIVSNPLKDIDPSKDVVVGPETGEDSIDGEEVKLYSDFNYRLNSSEIPANRAYEAKSWSVSDTFDRVHDEWTGIWAVYAQNDVYDGDQLVVKKGDLLQDSSGKTGLPEVPVDPADPEGEQQAAAPLFDVVFDEASYTAKVTATQAYLDLVNTRGDLPQAFSVYTKMIRIAPGEKIENQVDETYNEVDRESNIVWTKTPENPAIDVEKYTLDEGFPAGDRDKPSDAYPLKSANLGVNFAPDKIEQPEAPETPEVPEAPVDPIDPEDPATGTDPEEPELNRSPRPGIDRDLGKKKAVDVGFFVENTGDVPLVDVKVVDETMEGTSGKVENILCEVPFEYNGLATTFPGAPDTRWIMAKDVTTLALGQKIECVGQLFDAVEGELHSDEVTATGKSVFTGKEVSDDDQWHAKSPANSISVEKYTLDEGFPKGDRDTAEEAYKVTDAQLKDGLKIGFTVTNTGDQVLTDVKLVDQSLKGTTGTVKDIVCEAAAGDKGGATLKPGESFDCVGTLVGMDASTWHADTATATGKDPEGNKLKDTDPWFGKHSTPKVDPPAPDGPKKVAVTGEMIPTTGPQGGLWIGLGLLALALAAATTYAVSRKRRAVILTEAGAEEGPQR